MTKITIILSVVIAILLGSLSIAYKKMRSYRDDSIRWEHNYTESQNDIQRIQLTSQEFKDQISDLEDSLLTIKNIKPKQVERIIYIENEYINTDTSNVALIQKDDTEKDVFVLDFEVTESCLSISGIIKTKDPETTMSLTRASFKNKYTYIAYWKRKQWKLLGIKTRIFGKKYGELEVASSCGNSIVKEIDIIKKK